MTSWDADSPLRPYGLVQTVAPTIEPVSVEEVIGSPNSYTGDPSTGDNENVLLLIKAARELFENDTGLQLITATWALTLDSFPRDTLIIPSKAPWLTISSITYTDGDGTSQTLAAANYRFHAATGRIDPAFGYSWPGTRPQTAAVTVTFTAGYGTAATSVPSMPKLCIKAMCLDWLAERVLRFDVLPGVRSMIDRCRHGRMWG